MADQIPTPSSTILPGILGRLVQGVRYAITGVDPGGWFSPGEPLRPVAPDYVAGRAWDFPVGYNLAITPRAWEGNGFEDLRVMADAWDVIRLLIETRKDQLSRMSWSVRKRDPAVGRRIAGRSAPTQASDPTAQSIQAFLEYPNKVDDWASWLRQCMEQVLVYDALSIYPVRTTKGDLYSLEILDGSTIAPRINPDGRTPVPPDVAFQQVIKGLPAVDYTSDELIYAPRNKRVERVYGFSPVEQILTTINIALRRQASQLYYFTTGSNPDAFVYCPKEWTTDQIREYQKYWDMTFEGNLAARRRTKFVPGEGKFQETKPPPLKDEFDEWLTRIACYAFSLPPQWAVRQMNRASAQQQADAANEEGLFPYMQYLKGVVDKIIRHHAGRPDYEFVWEVDTYASPAQRVLILTKYVLGGVMTPNEARNELGLEEHPAGDDLFMPSAMATVEAIHENLEFGGGDGFGGGGGGGATPGPANGNSSVRPKKPWTDTTPGGNTSTNDRTKGEPTQKAVTVIEKGVTESGNHPFDGPHHEHVGLHRQVIRQETRELKSALRAEFSAISGAVQSRARDALLSVNKVDALPHETDLVDQILNNLGWAGLLAGLAPIVSAILINVGEATAAGVAGALDLSSAATSDAIASAIDYANDRSAELVGYARNFAGDLIPTDAADLNMLDSTRSMLNEMLSGGLGEGADSATIAATLADVFSADRADMIAEYEVNRASNMAVLATLQAGSLENPEIQKLWIVRENCCKRCADNAAAGPLGINDTFPSGDQTPGAHPFCRCELTWTGGA